MGTTSAKLFISCRSLAALLLLLAAAAIVRPPPAYAQEPPHASSWVTDHASRARLIAGGMPSRMGQPPQLVAGLEIEMDDGWKTYWRNPGTSGVPPRFDFAGSENLAEAIPLYPAPARIADRDGDTIGYKKSVVFPISVRPADPSKAVTLKLAAEYGVCKDVCIPVQPALSLVIPPGTASTPAGNTLAKALDQVPRPAENRRLNDPKLGSVKIDLATAKPAIVLDAIFGNDTKGADIFLEAPDGIWIPMPKRVGDVKDGRATFVVDLTDGADLADLKGREIRVTLVSSGGHSETSFTFK